MLPTDGSKTAESKTHESQLGHVARVGTSTRA